MKEIITKVQPFTMNQLITVVEDGKIIDAQSVMSSDIPDMIYVLSKKHDIKNITLDGPKDYLEKFANQIQELKFDLEEENYNIKIV